MTKIVSQGALYTLENEKKIIIKRENNKKKLTVGEMSVFTPFKY